MLALGACALALGSGGCRSWVRAEVAMSDDPPRCGTPGLRPQQRVAVVPPLSCASVGEDEGYTLSAACLLWLDEFEDGLRSIDTIIVRDPSLIRVPLGRETAHDAMDRARLNRLVIIHRFEVEEFGFPLPREIDVEFFESDKTGAKKGTAELTSLEKEEIIEAVRKRATRSDVWANRVDLVSAHARLNVVDRSGDPVFELNHDDVFVYGYERYAYRFLFRGNALEWTVRTPKGMPPTPRNAANRDTGDYVPDPLDLNLERRRYGRELARYITGERECGREQSR